MNRDKKGSLRDALRSVAVSPRDVAVRGVVITAKPPSRRGKQMIAGHFEPTVAHQLKRLAVDERTSVQALLGEGISEVFGKRGLPKLI
jgi:hypothetical protein